MHSFTQALVLIFGVFIGLASNVLAASSDPFYDMSVFPNADDAVALLSTQTQDEAQANKASCTPVSYATPHPYKLVAEPGPHCSYQSWVSVYTTDVAKEAGIRQCQDRCNKEARCRSFNWSLDSITPKVGACELSANFYDASVLQCDNSSTNSYLAVYNATNWTPPEPLIPNGNFETGCLKPWFFMDFTSDNSMQATMVECNRDCAPGGGKRYVNVTGNGQKGDPRDHIDAYIGQQPALTESVKYRLTAHIRGDSGEFRFTYPVHQSVVIRANATAEWKKVTGTFMGRNVGTFLIQMDSPGKANFAVDNVKVEKV
ncbi:uncharacterized protein HMPREF1541_09080 [Cyphellophora europaea CBS 101466]|uniref:Apple domain-containing protein n=1 Tax=Cyphellophora europaea (strain CBS 101466) TaxID=1220924 RepID=W2RJZ9_CYPE1|nr:uncharacterized protein HMPREF1541_09080 [Cyphellophora europaea CBS 101466]ETN36802.1 hypothetical protein HMPREF1541_09080 [Cyphellophora europaea CBS 101466]